MPVLHLHEKPLNNRDIALAYLIKAGAFKGQLSIYWGERWHMYCVTPNAYALFQHRESLDKRIYTPKAVCNIYLF